MTSSTSGTPVDFPSYAELKSGILYILEVAKRINASPSSNVSQQQFDVVQMFMKDYLSVPWNHEIYRDYHPLKMADSYAAIRKRYEQTKKPQMKALPKNDPLQNASQLELDILEQIGEMKAASKLIKRGEVHDLHLRPLREYQETLEILLHLRNPNGVVVTLTPNAKKVVKTFRIIQDYIG